MNKRRHIPIVLALATALVGGCASGPRLERFDADGLFSYGESMAQERNWTQAINAFQRFTFEFPTHPRYQEARFELAEAYFGDKQYVTAANEYSRLADDFPAGPWADDSRFRVCEAYHQLSPRIELDQEYTRAALQHCQSLIAYHPGSPFEERARAMIVELRDKLARKILHVADYYQRRGAVDSAILYYEQAVAEYPDTAVAPRALLRLVRIYGRLQYREEGQSARERLLRDYADTAEARELQGEAA